MAKRTFDEFLADRQAAAKRYVSGDGTPLDALLPHEGEASFHSPSGDTVLGAREVATRYMRDASSFVAEGETRFEVIQKVAVGDLAFFTGFQIAKVHLHGKSVPIEMRLRVTEVFRRDGDDWKLVHRHADMGAPPSKG